MEIKGKVIEVGQTTVVSDKLSKRELIVEFIENPQYPEYIKFEAVNDKCQLLDGVWPGAEIEVSFNLKGRKWTDKTGKTLYFNTLQLWRVKTIKEGNAPQSPSQSAYTPPATQDDDDLPF